MNSLEVSGTWRDGFCFEHLFGADGWHSLECILRATVGCTIQNLLERNHALQMARRTLSGQGCTWDVPGPKWTICASPGGQVAET